MHTCLLRATQSTLSFSTFCGPKISQAQNGFPRLTRLVFRRRLPVQHIAWTAFLLPARLFPAVARQSATQLSHTTFSHNLLSIIWMLFPQRLLGTVRGQQIAPTPVAANLDSIRQNSNIS
jgi:hypothetical protein